MSTVKYPRTPHLPFSPGISADDIILNDDSASDFTGSGKKIIITEKLDGGNCCLWNGKVFARTHSEETTHPSFGAIKAFSRLIHHRTMEHFGEETDIQLFFENLYSIHAIEYDKLTSYFFLLAVLRNKTEWLSWEDVVKTGHAIDVPTPPVVFEGEFSTVKELREFIQDKAKQPSVFATTTPEGFVVRTSGSFHMDDFHRNTAKFVRKNHVQMDSTWKRNWKTAKLVDNEYL